LDDGLWLEGRFGAPCCIVEMGEKPLQFEVENQTYFLNFVPDEGRWYVFSPTEDGMIKIPVAMDVAPLENFSFVSDEEKKKIVH
jgi:hypothetical protein